MILFATPLQKLNPEQVTVPEQALITSLRPVLASLFGVMTWIPRSSHAA